VVELILKALKDFGKRVGVTALCTAEHIGDSTAYAGRDEVSVNGQGTRADARNLRQGDSVFDARKRGGGQSTSLRKRAQRCGGGEGCDGGSGQEEDSLDGRHFIK
jgi:hypothetical protein